MKNIKRKYRGIKVPYAYYDSSISKSGYIYKDKFYADLNELFKDFVGFYLNYHVLVNTEEVIVHGLEDVAELLILNYPNAKIPSKYKDEYSEMEYRFLMRLLKHLEKKDFIKPEYHELKPWFFRNFDSYKWYRANKEMQQYKDVIFPKKVYSNVYKREVYVLRGEIMGLFSALDEVVSEGLYYKYRGEFDGESVSNSHQHRFENVIDRIFYVYNDFEFCDDKEKFYSRQEVKFLEALIKRLEELSYKTLDKIFVDRNFFYSKECNVYWRYVDEKKHIKAFLMSLKLKRTFKTAKKEELRNHKLI